MQENQSAAGLPLGRAVGYFRSTGARGGDHQVTPEQERAFVVCCQRVGYEPAGTFADSESSNGGTGPLFAAMLRQVRRDGGKYMVLVPGLEVFGRRPYDAAVSVLELDDLGAHVQVIAGAAVNPVAVVLGPAGQTPPGVDLGERIRSGMRSRAIRGEGLGKPPYGYRIGANKKLEVVRDEADVVRLIFELYTQRNLGIRLVVRHLNENHICTRKGRNWSMVTIRDILRNRTYLGTYSRFGMRVPGSHQSIISPDEFRWVQTKLEQRKPKRGVSHAGPFLLSGLVFCGSCGNRMVGVTRRQSWVRRKDGARAEKQYRYYQCQSRTNQSVCQYHTRRAADLEAGVLAGLQQQRSQVAGAKGRRDGSATPQAKERELRRLEAAKKKVEGSLHQALEQVSGGKLSYQRFLPAGRELIHARRDLEDRVTARRESLALQDGAAHPGELAAQAIDRLSEAWETMEVAEKGQLLDQLVERIIVFDDRCEVGLRLG